MHPPAISGMALIFLMLIVTENHEFVAAQNCGIGGGSGLGQFGRVYSADFETSEDCEQQCEYVTGEAEAICKVWQYRLLSFKWTNTKLKRFLVKNQLYTENVYRDLQGLCGVFFAISAGKTL